MSCHEYIKVHVAETQQNMAYGIRDKGYKADAAVGVSHRASILEQAEQKAWRQHGRQEKVRQEGMKVRDPILRC
jgi:hypothetical protein